MSDDDKKRPQEQPERRVEKRGSRQDRELSEGTVRHSDQPAQAWSGFDPEGTTNRPEPKREDDK